MTSQTQVPVPTRPAFTPVQSGLLQRKCACGGSAGVSGECAECGEQKLSLQRSTENSKRATRNTELETRNSRGVPPIVHEVLRSPGQPLDAETRAFFEPRFGHDFSQVRVHTDARAAESARGLNALAYTLSQDVVFGAGQFQTATGAGLQLLAHELAHTLQQPVSRSPIPSKLQMTSATDPSEHTADAAADAVMRGQSFTLTSVGQVSLARQIAPSTQGELSPTASDQTTAQDNGPTVTITQERDQVVVLIDGVPIRKILLHGQGSVSMMSEWDAVTKTLKIGLILPENAESQTTPEAIEVAARFEKFEIIESRSGGPPSGQLEKGGVEGSTLTIPDPEFRRNLPEKKQPVKSQPTKLPPTESSKSAKPQTNQPKATSGKTDRKICGPEVTVWLMARMLVNSKSSVVAEMKKNNSEDWKGVDVGSLLTWYQLVKTGGPWDYKKDLGAAISVAPCRQNCSGKLYSITLDGQCMTYEVVANIHYAYVGRAAGFTENRLLKGASDAQVSEGRGETKDDPRDVQAIKKGFALFDAGSPSGLSKSGLEANYYQNVPAGDGDPAGCEPCPTKLQ